VFQCPPMEEFKIARQFTFTDYDTVTGMQFSRRGSLQLRTWEFDTLIMEIGASEDAFRYTPGWVPYPQFSSPGRPVAPAWFLQQIETLHNSGAPFRFAAAFPNAQSSVAESSRSLTVLYTSAVLTAYTEGHRAGEGDAVYLEGVQFTEWRDPYIQQRALRSGNGKTQWRNSAAGLPATVTLRRDGSVLTARHQRLPPSNATTGGSGTPDTPAATLSQLSTFFYHTPEFWRLIADANHLRNIGPNTPLINNSKFKKIGKNGVKLTIPSPYDQPSWQSSGGRPDKPA
jgi:hypothetical protein